MEPYLKEEIENADINANTNVDANDALIEEYR